MQKQSEFKHRTSSAVPLISLLLIGLLYFGVFIALLFLFPEAVKAPRTSIIFISTYAGIGALTCLVFLLKELFIAWQDWPDSWSAVLCEL